MDQLYLPEPAPEWIETHLETPVPWYDDMNSACPECGHGPKWHNDPSGCTRMNASWCYCTIVYTPDSKGQDDRA